jgi:hypothetical protein
LFLLKVQGNCGMMEWTILGFFIVRKSIRGRLKMVFFDYMQYMCVPLVRSTLGANVILFDAFSY